MHYAHKQHTTKNSIVVYSLLINSFIFKMLISISQSNKYQTDTNNILGMIEMLKRHQTT